MPEILQLSSMCDIEGGQVVLYMLYQRDPASLSLDARPRFDQGYPGSRVVIDQFLHL
jgi:hypothetical protein